MAHRTTELKGPILDCTQWKPQIEKAVATYGRRLPAEQRDDMRQDCYLALVEKADKVLAVVTSQGLDSGGKYVYRIVSNRCLYTLRKTRRHGDHFPEMPYQKSPIAEAMGVWSGSHNDGDPGFHDLRGADDVDEQPMNGELARIAQYGVSNSMLEAAIGRLPVEEQHVIRELFYQGNSERGAGQMLDRSQRWTRTRKRRALEHLREELGSAKEKA